MAGRYTIEEMAQWLKGAASLLSTTSSVSSMDEIEVQGGAESTTGSLDADQQHNGSSNPTTNTPSDAIATADAAPSSVATTTGLASMSTLATTSATVTTQEIDVAHQGRSPPVVQSLPAVGTRAPGYANHQVLPSRMADVTEAADQGATERGGAADLGFTMPTVDGEMINREVWKATRRMGKTISETLTDWGVPPKMAAAGEVCSTVCCWCWCQTCWHVVAYGDHT